MMLDSNDRGKMLLSIARMAISRTLHVSYALEGVGENIAWLSRPGATFVTLMLDGELRGCIGSLQANVPLIDDVSNNAVAAAFHDPRFIPLSANELETVAIEVSLLSELQPVKFCTEADVLMQLRPHIDGVVFEYESQRSTFLPQVWESISSPQQFLVGLKNKAQIPEDFWSENIRLLRYTVNKWSETDNTQE